MDFKSTITIAAPFGLFSQVVPPPSNSNCSSLAFRVGITNHWQSVVGPSPVSHSRGSVAKMDAATSEAAQPWDRIAQLEALAADLSVRNAALEARLAAFEGRAEEKRQSKRPNCGVSSDGPVFPAELMIAIAGFLDPGSRTLSNLARTCRTLYELLVPHLFKSIDLDLSGWKFKGAIRDDPSTPSRLPYGIHFVKRIRRCRRIGGTAGCIRCERAIMEACPNLIEVNCSLTFFAESMVGATLPRLELLGLDLDYLPRATISPSHFAGLFSLRTLKITGYPSGLILELLGSGFPNLETVDADFAAKRIWEPRRLVPSFASKVRSWTFNEPNNIKEIIKSTPSFRPQAIILSDAAEWTESIDNETWLLMCCFDSLKCLSIDKFDSSLLLRGFPPSLDELTVRRFLLSIRSEADLDALANMIPSLASNARLSLHHADMSEDFHSWFEDDDFLFFAAELELWMSVDGFKIEGDVESVWERRRQIAASGSDDHVSDGTFAPQSVARSPDDGVASFRPMSWKALPKLNLYTWNPLMCAEVQ